MSHAMHGAQGLRMIVINSRNYRINHGKHEVCHLLFGIVRKICPCHVAVEKGVNEDGSFDCNTRFALNIDASFNTFSILRNEWLGLGVPGHTTDQVVILRLHRSLVDPQRLQTQKLVG